MPLKRQIYGVNLTTVHKYYLKPSAEQIIDIHENAAFIGIFRDPDGKLYLHAMSDLTAVTKPTKILRVKPGDNLSNVDNMIYIYSVFNQNIQEYQHYYEDYEWNIIYV